MGLHSLLFRLSLRARLKRVAARGPRARHRSVRHGAKAARERADTCGMVGVIGRVAGDCKAEAANQWYAAADTALGYLPSEDNYAAFLDAMPQPNADLSIGCTIK